MSNRRVHHSRVETYKTENTVLANRAVVFSTTDGNCKLPAGANANGVIGITKYGAAADADCEIVEAGCAELTVNAASVNIAPGDPIKVGTTAGIGVKAATDKDHAFATARESATTDGALISVKLEKYDLGV